MAEDIEAAADRVAIREAIQRFFVGMDRYDLEMMRSAFADEIEYKVETKVVASGIEALMVWVSKAAPPRMKSHVMGNCSILLDGDKAEAETYVTVYRIETADPTKVLVRGARDLDRLRRTAAGWRITYRRAVVDWTFEAPLTFLASERVAAY